MIAILAPYDRSETTLAALRVADLALAEGYDVYYLVSGTKGHGIHRYWDTKAVAHSHRDKLKRLLPAKFKHLVTFSLLPLSQWTLLPTLGLVTPSTFTDVVISPYELVRGEAAEWKMAQRIICPSESTYRLAMSVGHLTPGRTAITKLTWATGDESVPAAIETPIKFASICDSGCLREYPEIWLNCIDHFLQYTVDATLDCYLAGSLPKRARWWVRELYNRHGNRFTTQSVLNIQDFVVWLRDRDVAIYPSCRTVFGMYPAICRAIRMPLIAAQVSPLTESVPDNLHSLLVKLPKAMEPCGVERAQFDSASWLNVMNSMATNPYQLLDHTETAEKLRNRTELQFTEFWRQSWTATAA